MTKSLFYESNSVPEKEVKIFLLCRAVINLFFLTYYKRTSFRMLLLLLSYTLRKSGWKCINLGLSQRNKSYINLFDFLMARITYQ